MAASLTPLFSQAIERVSLLSPAEQDTIATLILRELDPDNRIRFHIPEVNSVHEANGELFLEGEFLVFRFAVVHWGVTEGEWETVKVERALIDGVRAKQGLFRDKLMIATDSRRLRETIPGKHDEEIVLRTRKKDRFRVGAFLERVRAWRRVRLSSGVTP